MDTQEHAWEDLRLVLAIARGGGLSGASRILGLHHATVLRRLNSFEYRMGVILFERKARGYEPTPIGEEVAAIAARIECDVGDAYRQIVAHDIRLCGSIRFATSDFLAQTLLPPILATFQKKYPHIEIAVNISPQFASLSRRDADVAIRASKDKPQGLAGKCVGHLTYGIYGHRALIEEGGGSGDIEQFDWVGSDHTLAHVSINQWRLAEFKEAKVCARFDSMLGIYGAIRSKMGIGFLPHFMASNDDDLICLKTNPQQWTLGLWLLYHPDMRQMSRIKAFLEFSEAELKTYDLCRLGANASRALQIGRGG